MQHLYEMDREAEQRARAVELLIEWQKTRHDYEREHQKWADGREGPTEHELWLSQKRYELIRDAALAKLEILSDELATWPIIIPND